METVTHVDVPRWLAGSAGIVHRAKFSEPGIGHAEHHVSVLPVLPAGIKSPGHDTLCYDGQGVVDAAKAKNNVLGVGECGGKRFAALCGCLAAHLRARLSTLSVTLCPS